MEKKTALAILHLILVSANLPEKSSRLWRTLQPDKKDDVIVECGRTSVPEYLIMSAGRRHNKASKVGQVCNWHGPEAGYVSEFMLEEA